jgi:hypothetical protein
MYKRGKWEGNGKEFKRSLRLNIKRKSKKNNNNAGTLVPPPLPPIT